MTTPDERGTNKKLIEKYPWLMPRSQWDGTLPEGYDYEWTRLDEMEPGWKKAFGIQMQEELLRTLKATGCVESYGIMQIKEKWGRLCWYDYGGNESTDEIVNKYSTLSANICVVCGMPDVPATTGGWILPICGTCYSERTKRSDDDYIAEIKDSPIMMDERPHCGWNSAGGEWLYDFSATANEIRRNYNKKEA